MKRKDFGAIVRLTKNYLKDEHLWGETEVTPASNRTVSRKPGAHAPAVEHTPGKQPHAQVNEKSAACAPAASAAVPAQSARALPAAPPLPGDSAEAQKQLDELARGIAACRKCPLGSHRLVAVPGAGNPRARVMFVGEGPGFEEDHQGLPFVGKAGQLLTKIIESIGLTRETVFIGNVVKCHPMIDPSDPEKRGNDRPPAPDEMSACLPYLEQQIALIKPACICTLGNVSTKALLNVETGITKLRGHFFDRNGVKVLPTYHPAALLRNPLLKKDTWEDMKKLRDELNK